MKKKRHGHYCIVCGKYLANEKFSGKGHAKHICRDCMKIPSEKREEIITINRIMSLHFDLSKNNRKWLRSLLNDPREDVREAAYFAWDLRYEPDYMDEWNGEEWHEDEWSEADKVWLEEERRRYYEEDYPQDITFRTEEQSAVQ